MSTTVTDRNADFATAIRGITSFFVLRATYFYEKGTSETCVEGDGPFLSRESAAHYASLYHHVPVTKECLADNEWSAEVPKDPLLVAGPGWSWVIRVVVEVIEIEINHTFYSTFESKRLAEAEQPSS